MAKEVTINTWVFVCLPVPCDEFRGNFGLASVLSSWYKRSPWIRVNYVLIYIALEASILRTVLGKLLPQETGQESRNFSEAVRNSKIAHFITCNISPNIVYSFLAISVLVVKLLFYLKFKWEILIPHHIWTSCILGNDSEIDQLLIPMFKSPVAMVLDLLILNAARKIITIHTYYRLVLPASTFDIGA